MVPAAIYTTDQLHMSSTTAESIPSVFMTLLASVLALFLRLTKQALQVIVTNFTLLLTETSMEQLQAQQALLWLISISGIQPLSQLVRHCG
jgi:hypothetical protein